MLSFSSIVSLGLGHPVVIRWIYFPLLLALGLWASLLRSVAAADGVALNFDLPPVTPTVAAPRDEPLAAAPPEGPQVVTAEPGPTPLPIPEGAGHPPTTRSRHPMPASVYGDPLPLVAAAAPLEAVIAALPPAPAIAPHEGVRVAAPQTAAPTEALSFALPGDPETVAAAPNVEVDLRADPVPAALPGVAAPSPSPALARDAIFQGGSESLVARVVGSAEGTRTAEGIRTPAFYGHVDPGNGVWNLGTFSYQHGASSPEEADRRQLQRLKTQTRTLEQRATTVGLTLSLLELLNGIDLANQAPAAALGRQGYLDWLAEAYRLGMAGDEAILWARTRAFLDPDTQRWNAPGLGNTVASISRDQERRMVAIERALVAFDPLAVPPLVAKEPEGTPADPTVSAPTVAGSRDAIAGEPEPSPNAEVLDFVGSLPGGSLPVENLPVGSRSAPAQLLNGSLPAAADLALGGGEADPSLSEADVWAEDLFAADVWGEIEPAEAISDGADGIPLAQPAAQVIEPKKDSGVLTYKTAV